MARVDLAFLAEQRASGQAAEMACKPARGPARGLSTNPERFGG
jgi:hypothetical protein